MFTYTGKTALITGASMGIGRAFALELAKRGMSVILVARSEDKLRTLAAEITKTYNVKADVIVADLAEAGAAQTLYQQVEQRKLGVDLLVNNAGLGSHGQFHTLSPDRDQQQLMVNVVAVVELARAFIPSMLKRPGQTAVMNIASTAAFQPIPYMSVYGASKAFVLSFSEGLAEEYRGTNLHVMTVCPGATDTPFFDAPGQGVRVGNFRTPEQVVASGLRGLERGKIVVVDGAQNAWLAELNRFLPRWVAARITARMMHPETVAQEQRGVRSHS